VILIGDPKQAIYAFRGGDIVTYLSASRPRQQMTLGTNWRSDEALVNRLQAVLGGAQLGHERIIVHDVAVPPLRLPAGRCPSFDPFRLRV